MIPEKRPLSFLFPEVNREVNTPTWRPRYKAPPPSAGTSAQSSLSPYLNHPSVELPIPTWLLTGEFVPHRIRLVEISGSAPPVEYFTPTEDGSEVIVRDGNTMRTIPVKDLRHLPPEKAFDLVVPITGEHKGQMMKVKDFGMEECTMTVFGAKRIQKKNYQYPRCNTKELALVAPPRK